MKKILLFAAAAFMVACSSDDLTVDNQKQAQLEEGAVGFDAYMQRTTTRSGLAMNDLVIGKLASEGFGVFGFYTDNKDYDQLALPNFMYNEKVYATGSAPYTWQYDVLKYWPNEYGYNAISDDADKVTFFAYAPYVPVTPSTGKVADGNDTWGITGITRNSNAGDPIVKYIASFANKYAVDLCWAVCQQNDWQLVESGQAQAFTLGKPWLNVQRPGAVDQKLKFQFKHATSKLQITIDEFNDDYKAAATDIDNSLTRIFVRSVRFTGFTMQGALNLNNETANEPYWMNYSGQGDLSVTDDVVVYDQRKDGKEGVAGAVATNEKVGGLNPKFIQKENMMNAYGKWKNDDPVGVTQTPRNLFDKKGGDFDWFYVIPSGDDMEIEIVYDVETISNNLYTTISDGVTHGSTIENRITKKIKFGDNISKLEPGKAYNIKLHIGMNDVDFDADIVDWDNMPTPDIDLPANLPAYAVTETTATLEIPGAATGFNFAVTDLKGGESVTAAPNDATGNPFKSATVTIGSEYSLDNKAANASGVAYLTVGSVAVNTTIADVTTANAVTVSPAVTGGTFNLKVIQKAEALGLKAPSSTGSLVLQREVLSEAWSATNTACPALTGYTAGTTTNNYIRVWRNGTELPYGSETNQFTFDNATGTITLGSAVSAETGDVIKVTIKASTVSEETISFTY